MVVSSSSSHLQKCAPVDKFKECLKLELPQSEELVELQRSLVAKVPATAHFDTIFRLLAWVFGAGIALFLSARLTFDKLSNKGDKNSI